MMSLSKWGRVSYPISPSFIWRNCGIKRLHFKVSRIHWAFTIIDRIFDGIFLIWRAPWTTMAEHDLWLDWINLSLNMRHIAFLLSWWDKACHWARSMKLWWCVSKLYLWVHEGLRKLFSDIACGLPSLIFFWVLRNKFFAANPLSFVMFSPFRSSEK